MRLDDGMPLLFAVAFALVFLTPPFTPYTFPADSLLRWGDVLDLLTPVVMLPMYWLVLTHRRSPPPRWEIAVFLVLGAIWIEGQGIHLAANSIGHQPSGGPARALTELYDEKLGHLLWHGAALALAALVVVRRAGGPAFAGSRDRLLGGVAALVYGFAFFLIAVEGATGILSAAGGLVVVGLALRCGPRPLLKEPAITLFGAGHALSLVLLGTWFVYWGGRLPEFSSLGLIK